MYPQDKDYAEENYFKVDYIQKLIKHCKNPFERKQLKKDLQRAYRAAKQH